MSYRAPLEEMAFAADRVIGQDALSATTRFAEAGPETRAAILEEAAKLCEGVVAPLNRVGDLTPARLENGVVRCPPGFADALAQIAAGGWVGMAASPEHGGLGLPQSFVTMVGEMMAGANLALSLCGLLSQGAIEALEHHGAPELQALYLPKLTAGVWTGTMNLTEPQAGSDVGALATRAEPAGDGSYRITGQKIYITWGDHDAAENIVHLVLARLPGAPAGTRGISLFLVPKLIPDAAGRPGLANRLRCVSLEHKLGIHGSPTAMMAYEGATGWMVGPENGGMAAMFTMMNNARLAVGAQGVGLAEAATQKALAFALDRRQGQTPDGNPGIAGHADVRRMLMTMKALTQVARALCYDCAFSIDMAAGAEQAETRERHQRRAAFLTPIAKAFSTDAGVEVASLGLQVHGGMGYIEETGAAQYFRDARIAPIYEGTNGIQAMDLVGRKLSMDRGATAREMIASVGETAARLALAGPAFAPAAEAAVAAAEDAARATDWMLAAEPTERNAGAAAYLRLVALALGTRALGRAALAAADGPRAADRLALATFFATRIAPETAALARAATAGSAALYAIPAERLAE